VAAGVLGRSQHHVVDTRGRDRSRLAAHSPTVITAHYRADPTTDCTPERIQAIRLAWADTAARAHEYPMTAEQRVEWEAEVRSLYDGMVRIVVTPTGEKLMQLEPPAGPAHRSDLS
jgi:hypothetical protein